MVKIVSASPFLHEVILNIRAYSQATTSSLGPMAIPPLAPKLDEARDLSPMSEAPNGMFEDIPMISLDHSLPSPELPVSIIANEHPRTPQEDQLPSNMSGPHLDERRELSCPRGDHPHHEATASGTGPDTPLIPRHQTHPYFGDQASTQGGRQHHQFGVDPDTLSNDTPLIPAHSLHSWWRSPSDSVPMSRAQAEALELQQLASGSHVRERLTHNTTATASASRQHQRGYNAGDGMDDEKSGVSPSRRSPVPGYWKLACLHGSEARWTFVPHRQAGPSGRQTFSSRPGQHRNPQTGLQAGNVAVGRGFGDFAEVERWRREVLW